jgi:hypothetical protein
MATVPTFLMSRVPPTAESWLARVPRPEVWKQPIYHRPPYQHHKDHVGEVESIFRALSGDIPFGGLTKLSQATNTRDSTRSSIASLQGIEPIRHRFPGAQSILTAPAGAEKTIPGDKGGTTGGYSPRRALARGISGRSHIER